jgi:1-deoxy-D-xylulose-5-phosphate reductoisomerase
MVENRESPRKIAVLGSTGSIGQQTLDIVRAFPDQFKVVGLAAGENLDLLQLQINEFKPKVVSYNNQRTNPDAKAVHRVSIEEIAGHPEVETVVIATSGSAGLGPLLTAIKADKKVALANKEPLVMAGEIILAEMKNSSGWILPVDSEHSAIWQCMNGENLKPARIILTASGGPFLRYSLAQLEGVTPEQALRHPSWHMGKKVTVDSATLMNKGLEIIEAHWLFDMAFDDIEVLIHPQSIVHSMVELKDGTIKAQLSCPDMRFPIQYALSYPDRLPNASLPRLDWRQIKSLQFEQPDPESFPCLKLAIEAGKKGGTYPAVLCAADEAAVRLFLDRKIKFTEIPRLIGNVLERHQPFEHPDIEAILLAEDWARGEVDRLFKGVK